MAAAGARPEEAAPAASAVVPGVGAHFYSSGDSKFGAISASMPLAENLRERFDSGGRSAMMGMGA